MPTIYRNFRIYEQDGEILTEGTGDLRADVGGPYDALEDAKADVDRFWADLCEAKEVSPGKWWAYVNGKLLRHANGHARKFKSERAALELAKSGAAL